MTYDSTPFTRRHDRVAAYAYLGKNAAAARWPKEREEQLAKMWADGKTAAQCARELGGVSRNAVIGKVHRLGLPKRANDGKHTAQRAVAKKRRGRALERQRQALIKKHRLDGHREMSAEERAIAAEKARVSREKHERAARLRCDALLPLTDQTGARVGVATLQPHHCRFPVGDPKAADFGFCARPRAGGPYCPDHSALAYNGRALADAAAGPVA